LAKPAEAYVFCFTNQDVAANSNSAATMASHTAAAQLLFLACGRQVRKPMAMAAGFWTSDL